MIKLNPAGGAQSFMAPLPSTRAYAHETRAALRDGFRGLVPAATPVPTAPTEPEPDSEEEYDAVLAGAESSLGVEAVAKILSADDRATARADPLMRAKIIARIKGRRADTAKKEAVATLEAAKDDALALDRERGRVGALGNRLAEAEASARKARA